MRSTFARYSPAFVAALVCFVIVAQFAHAIDRESGGTFVYPLDDSYIHLALAQNLAFFHTWGINPTDFASASSSPGWTLLLAAADRSVGSHLTTPIWLNLALSALLLVIAVDALDTFAPKAPEWFRYLVPLVLVLVTPLPNLAFLGMEHVAQALTILVLVLAATRILLTSPHQKVPGRTVALLLATAAIAGAIRYEAIFAILPISLLLAFRRRLPLAIAVAACSAMAPLAFGLYFHSRSGFWLPYSVMIKATMNHGGMPAWSQRFVMLAGIHGGIPMLRALLPLWVLRLFTRGFWDDSQLLLFFASCIFVCHTLLAPTGWLMRYESYFVCLGLFALAVALAPTRSVWAHKEHRVLTVIAVLGILSLLPHLIRRVANGVTQPVQAAVDRFNEHIQMSRFLVGAYDRDTVVVDDIGAVAYYTHEHLLDMAGLGSVEPLLASRKSGSFTRQDMGNWARSSHASIAVIQSGGTGYRALIPPGWIQLQTWRMPRNIVFGDFDTTFYAINSAETARLCRSLSQFHLTPHDTIVDSRCH